MLRLTPLFRLVSAPDQGCSVLLFRRTFHPSPCTGFPIFRLTIRSMSIPPPVTPRRCGIVETNLPPPRLIQYTYPHCIINATQSCSYLSIIKPKCHSTQLSQVFPKWLKRATLLQKILHDQQTTQIEYIYVYLSSCEYIVATLMMNHFQHPTCGINYTSRSQ